MVLLPSSCNSLMEQSPAGRVTLPAETAKGSFTRMRSDIWAATGRALKVKAEARHTPSVSRNLLFITISSNVCYARATGPLYSPGMSASGRGTNPHGQLLPGQSSFDKTLQTAGNGREITLKVELEFPIMRTPFMAG